MMIMVPTSVLNSIECLCQSLVIHYACFLKQKSPLIRAKLFVHVKIIVVSFCRSCEIIKILGLPIFVDCVFVAYSWGCNFVDKSVFSSSRKSKSFLIRRGCKFMDECYPRILRATRILMIHSISESITTISHTKTVKIECFLVQLNKNRIILCSY